MVCNIAPYNSNHNRELLSSKQIEQIDTSRLSQYIKYEYFTFQDVNDNKCLALTSQSSIPPQVRSKADRLILLDKQQFHDLMAEKIAQLNLIKSKEYLAFISKGFVARDTKLRPAIVKMVLWFALFYFAMPELASFTFGFIFLLNIVYRFSLICLGGKQSRQREEDILLKNSEIKKPNKKPELPIYTLLVPLYKEAARVPGMIKAIERILYPKTKLDVKFIIEADDIITARAIMTTTIPSYIQIVKVPSSLPRTKPKALNYAASFAKGQYIAVYDAEDEPEPLQLLKAIKKFNSLPKDYACLQAGLRFYNQHECLLAYFINLEYKIWFGYILPALSKLKLPIPLGGTSNHFKTEVLQKVGYWDAYNVTEDAELGLRLHLKGYKVATLDAFTDEEAPNNLLAWLKQRTRWTKGFMKTSIIFLANTNWQSIRKITENFSVASAITMAPISLLCSPLIITSIYVKDGYNNALTLLNIIMLLLLTLMMLAVGCRRNGIYQKLSPLALLWLGPFWLGYFILHVVAAYWALLELIIKPHWWHKTEHAKTKTKYLAE